MRLNEGESTMNTLAEARIRQSNESIQLIVAHLESDTRCLRLVTKDDVIHYIFDDNSSIKYTDNKLETE